MKNFHTSYSIMANALAYLSSPLSTNLLSASSYSSFTASSNTPSSFPNSTARPFFFNSKRIRPHLCSSSRTTSRPMTTWIQAAATEVHDSQPQQHVSPSSAKTKLDMLRNKMNEYAIHAYIVPSGDPHNSEYEPICYQRRHWISQFNGSAGTAVITASPEEISQDNQVKGDPSSEQTSTEKALLWTDGRYFLQANMQLDSALWTLMKAGVPGTPTIERYLADSLPAGARVGIDPFAHTINDTKKLIKTLAEQKMTLMSIDKENLVDAIWETRPPFPKGQVRVQPLEYAGKTVTQKKDEIIAELKDKKAQALLLAMLDEVAWFCNIRGQDIPHCPVTLAYVLINANGQVGLYIDEEKLNPQVHEHLQQANVEVLPYQSIIQDLNKLAAAKAKIWLDPASVSWAIHNACCMDPATATTTNTTVATDTHHDHLILETSPVPMMKACKTPQEIQGMKEAHIKDGAALANFYAWMEDTIDETGISEYEVGVQLEKFRAQQENFWMPSFPTIAGSGPNGAVIHYSASKESARMVTTKELLLLDSGAQFVEGTTDITRTIHFGQPTERERDCFTRVLKGNISLTMAVFPDKTTGMMLDAFARMPLWAAGLDYRHGTGHGVGASLNVHEGPQSISPRINITPLKPGMILSNEPGYYEDGNFGIRIENLLIVTPQQTANRFNDVDYLGFEPLTLCPIQKKMIKLDLLSDDEITWLDSYHARVWDTVSPRVSGRAKEWLRENTLPIKKSPREPGMTKRDFITAMALILCPIFLRPQISRAADIVTSSKSLTGDTAMDQHNVTDKCYMDIAIGDEIPSRIIIGLYGDTVPNTVKNFKTLCAGTSDIGYKNSSFYRVVSGLTIQGGDIKKNGKPGYSIYGETFERENFQVQHNMTGIISMVNTKDLKNDSRFLINTKPDSRYLDEKYVGFGRVISGMDVVYRIEQIPTKGPKNQPQIPIKIMNCGIL